MSQRIDAHVCDILPSSLEWARQNQERFEEGKTLTLIEGDLRARVLSNGWHWIDLDPFGSPVTFLDPVIQAFARTGILEVSATDSAALTGSSRGPTMRRYGAVVRTNDWAHDSGLRGLLANIARVAACHDRAIEPLLSVWETHHLRVSVAIRRSKQGASNVEDNIGWRADPTPDEPKFPSTQDCTLMVTLNNRNRSVSYPSVIQRHITSQAKIGGSAGRCGLDHYTTLMFYLGSMRKMHCDSVSLILKSYNGGVSTHET